MNSMKKKAIYKEGRSNILRSL
jgi:hypothetical protein